MLSKIKKAFFHRNEVGICSICDQNFSENKLFEIDDLFLCKNDFKFYKNHSWKISETGKSSPNNPEQALYIQNKKDHFKELGIRSFIKVHYERVDNEIITSFFLYTSY